MRRTQDINVLNIDPLISPRELKELLPISERASETVAQVRQEIARIIEGDDLRMLVVVGPCSIHDKQAAYEYADRLNVLRQELQDRFLIVMRAYFHKPRTVIGWKGMLNDPFINGTSDMRAGLSVSREILMHLAEIGLPSGTELLDAIVPQYLADLICWTAVGARTTESQTHREMASGLSMPVGFKNSTEGNNQVAIDALQSARHPHHFLGVDQDGRIGVVATRGNPLGHIILRGGRETTNYDAGSIAATMQQLEGAGLRPSIMVDCSHANSLKRHELQAQVFEDVIAQRCAGNTAIMGLMLESNLFAGNQKIPDDLSQLKYGVSITDACIGWETTEELLRWGYNQLAKAPVEV